MNEWKWKNVIIKNGGKEKGIRKNKEMQEIYLYWIKYSNTIKPTCLCCSIHTQTCQKCSRFHTANTVYSSSTHEPETHKKILTFTLFFVFYSFNVRPIAAHRNGPVKREYHPSTN